MDLYSTSLFKNAPKI